MTTISSLRTLYKDPEIGLIGKAAFVRSLKAKNIKFDENLIDDLFEESALSLNKPAIKKFRRRHVFAPSIDHTWGSDLINMQSFKEENDGITYFLIVIDFFSKYSWVEALKDAKALTVSKAFEKIFKESKRKPENMNTDMGSEFKRKRLTYSNGWV